MRFVRSRLMLGRSARATDAAITLSMSQAAMFWTCRKEQPQELHGSCLGVPCLIVGRVTCHQGCGRVTAARSATRRAEGDAVWNLEKKNPALDAGLGWWLASGALTTMCFSSAPGAPPSQDACRWPCCPAVDNETEEQKASTTYLPGQQPH